MFRRLPFCLFWRELCYCNTLEHNPEIIETHPPNPRPRTSTFCPFSLIDLTKVSYIPTNRCYCNTLEHNPEQPRTLAYAHQPSVHFSLIDLTKVSYIPTNRCYCNTLEHNPEITTTSNLAHAHQPSVHFPLIDLTKVSYIPTNRCYCNILKHNPEIINPPNHHNHHNQQTNKQTKPNKPILEPLPTHINLLCYCNTLEHNPRSSITVTRRDPRTLAHAHQPSVHFPLIDMVDFPAL
ncbi:hypothetical protein J6590_043119 [Homalodisca vitripennis]|nr:hypothetical protein J6590_043119 [Homalodisca vitripennis]